ncbi:hypothetical protein [Curtobacterium sp. VKM Ac-2922]|uniref:hypothetical protein n=1 Tax=Curtobacterium sp. VKM Ac-2922 TaxID=2929475 RepID=UPI001FB32E7E|nr:hypothetical protein [Curtobacterium sp. VKM Ac-2922]MCJ1713855.1 hypothetical protein [Curtobacterium sp. VKM Ac-2922]
MTDVQPESILVQVTFAGDDGAPLTDVIRNQQDVLEVLDFALFLTHGDVVRWTNGGGRGQIRLARLDHGTPVTMDLELVMSGGLGLTHADALAGVTAAGTVLLTAAGSVRGDAAVDTPDRSARQTATDAEKHVVEAMERVAYDARGTDMAWRIREAEEQTVTSPEGTTGKGLRFVRAAGRLARRDGFDFRVE